MNIEESFKISIPLGSWDLLTGTWHYNPLLAMSEEIQRQTNELNGYNCQRPIEHEKARIQPSISAPKRTSA